MKQLVQKILFFLAHKIIDRHKPIIIGVTGSVGKTSTREAIFHVVKQKYRAYRPLKNYNNEFGLPLAIIGVESPGSSPIGWLQVLLKGFYLAYMAKAFPQVLVLEYGVDRPGDMDYLLSIAKPSISVITSIGISHYEFFKSQEAIAQEKGRLAEILQSNQLLIVNADNKIAFAQRAKTKAKVLSYGRNSGADICLESAQEYVNGQVYSSLHVALPARKLEARLMAVGTPHVEAALAAIAVAEGLGIEVDLIEKGIIEYRPAPGRLNILSGVKHTTIIDDTYNAAPTSMHEALELLARLPAQRKIAVLGDMRELGDLSEEAHKKMGEFVASLKLDMLYTVGEGGKQIANSALAAGMPKETIHSWKLADEAKQVIAQSLQSETLILIKGSQFVRLEKITKELMAEPMRAHDVLCRQYGDWLET